MSDLRVGWQAGPTGRGTFTLVYSCLFTIFTSTWTVLHLNIPGPYDGPWMKTLIKAKWMAITILMPELIFSKAICDLRLALNDLREFDEELKEKYKDNLKWSVVNEDIKLTWSWVVQYGPRASLLYWILGLSQPKALQNKNANKTASHKRANSIARSSFDVEDGKDALFATREPPKSDYPQTGSTREPRETAQDASVAVSVGSAQGNILSGIEKGGSSYDGAAIEKENPQGSQQKPIEKITIENQKPDEDNSGGPSSLRKRRTESRVPTPGQPLEVVEYLPRTQYWTLTHAYFANMGGLIYTEYNFNPNDEEPEYYVLTGVKLGHRYTWLSSGHPLRGLVLTKEDIDDKSKADGFLKFLTVIQVTWLVLTVIFRHVNGLPVSQLEIATLAFAVSAIATYAANWWKPKDISRPTLLQRPGESFVHENTPNPTQGFTLRLRDPIKAAERAKTIPQDSFVANDVVWMEGGVPVIFSIMAVSSLVFGGLHCLAWNSEFPSRAELMLWRASSLTSMILPIISLAFSLYLNYIATTYANNKLISSLLEKLKPLDAMSEEFWKALNEPSFTHWDQEERIILISIPTGLRNFDEKPPKEKRSQLEKDGKWAHYDVICWEVMHFFENLQHFYELWKRAKKGGGDAYLLQTLLEHMIRMEQFSSSESLGFWDDFESHLKDTILPPSDPLLGRDCIRHFLKVADQFKTEEKQVQKWKDACNWISQFLVISTGIVYVASRLIILVLLFTSLRAVPKGVYENTPWTRFLPSIS